MSNLSSVIYYPSFNISLQPFLAFVSPASTKLKQQNRRFDVIEIVGELEPFEGT